MRIIINKYVIIAIIRMLIINNATITQRNVQNGSIMFVTHVIMLYDYPNKTIWGIQSWRFMVTSESVRQNR